MSSPCSLEHHAVIKFQTKRQKSPKEIHTQFIQVYGESSPTYDVIKYWSKQFRLGRDSIEDEERSSRPKTARDDEVIKKVYELVLQNRRVRLFQIAVEMQNSYGSVFNTMHEDLGVSKVSARWVPRLLTIEQKQTRTVFCSENLQLAGSEKNFFSRVVTGDETWLHFYDPETK